MRKKIVRAIAQAGAVIFLLTGCSSMPELTPEQEEAIGEYAAVTLMKYDANNRSRLVDLSTVEVPETLAEESQETEAPAAETDSSAETPTTEAAPETNVPENNEAASMEAFFGLPQGVTVTYQGCNTFQVYPDENEGSEYFMLEASEGNSLLVLAFTIANQTGSDVEVNLLEENIIYRITVNGDTTRNALMTMLLNDMSTYRDTIAAGESADVVLIAEMDQGVLSSVSSISLRLRSETESYTIQLQ